MTQKFYKKVLMPIEVAEGKYCWGKEKSEEQTRCCGHFSNEGGHPTCEFELDDYSCLKYDKYGFVPKPKRRLQLVDAVCKKEKKNDRSRNNV